MNFCWSKRGVPCRLASGLRLGWRGIFGVAIVSLFATAAVAGAAFPNRPVTVIVPNAAGGPLDIMARIIVKNLQKLVPEPIVVQNIVGAGTAIGDRAAHDAAPDGYTLLVIHQSLLIASAEGTLGFNYKDMTPIARTGGQDPFWVAAPNAPFKTFPQFLSYVHAHPGTVRAGVFLTAHSHLVALALQDAAKGKMKLINIPGGGEPMVAALLSGQIDVALMSVDEGAPYIRAGRMVPLVLMGSRRAKKFPNIPTGAELGFPDVNFNVTNWWWLRHDVPQSIQNYWTDKLQEVMKEPQTIKELHHETDDTQFLKGEPLKKQIEQQYKKYDEIIVKNDLVRK